MKANVISLSDYKKKKLDESYSGVWWIPQIQVLFMPPFFWYFILV